MGFIGIMSLQGNYFLGSVWFVWLGLLLGLPEGTALECLGRKVRTFGENGFLNPEPSNLNP